MGTFQHIIISRQDIAFFNNTGRFLFIHVEQFEKHIMVRQFITVHRLLILIFMPYITVSHAVRPYQVIDIILFLYVHGDTLQTVSDFHGHRMLIDTADLLEISELRDFHAVQPHFPTDPPGAERGRLPVILDKADIMLLRHDPQLPQRLQIDFLNIIGRRFHDDLKLVVLIQTVWIIAVTSVIRTAGRFHIRHIPRLRPDSSEKRRRIHRPRPFLYIIRLLQYAAPRRPELLERQNNLLKSHMSSCK